MNLLLHVKKVIFSLMQSRGFNKLLKLYLFRKIKKERKQALVDQIKQNKQFKGIHRGERCFILGNGPSLREQDLSLLQDEVVFTVNQAAKLEGFNKIKTNYHFWADPQFFEPSGSLDGDKQLIETMLRVQTTDNAPQNFFPHIAYDFVIQKKISEALNVNFFYPLLPLHNMKERNDFSGVVTGAWTVVHYAIMLAIYMGFSEIYLLGCDMTGIITTVQSRLRDQETGCYYSYNITQAEKERMRATRTKFEVEDEFQGYVNMFSGYKFLNQCCKNNGIGLYNLTRGGILESVERKKYEDVISIRAGRKMEKDDE